MPASPHLHPQDCTRRTTPSSRRGLHDARAVRRTSRLNKRGIPMVALAVSMLGGIASLLTRVIAAQTVYLALVSIAGFAVVGVWMSIAASQFFHRRVFLRAGGDVRTLAYRTPFYPVVPVLAFGLCAVSLVGVALDPAQVAALYFGVPFVAICYLYYHLRHGRRRRPALVQTKENQAHGTPSVVGLPRAHR
ncbi:hypothetical protein [Nonomuraea sp. NPDC049625]|uniref:hypothetical protein n=1 Tax=Nonomuraea sp. NPDC049625 TaxID=3155775 RepID=UPI003419F84F